MIVPERITQKIVRAFGRAALTIACLIGAVVVAVPTYASFFVSRAEAVRDVVLPDPADYGLTYEDVSFPSRDGLPLRGWWLEADSSSPVIILVHGAGGNRAKPADTMLNIASNYLANNFNVLMFDLRAHGKSAGVTLTAGLYERNDLEGAIDFVRSRGIHSKIGVLGFSMGAATSIVTSAECKDISAVVADCSFASVQGVLTSQLAQRDLPTFLMPVLLYIAKALIGIDFGAAQPVEAVKSIQVPLLLIQSGRDDLIPSQDAFQLLAASSSPESRLWVVPEAKHIKAYLARPDEYMERTLSFFKDALQKGPGGCFNISVSSRYVFSPE